MLPETANQFDTFAHEIQSKELHPAGQVCETSPMKQTEEASQI